MRFSSRIGSFAVTSSLALLAAGCLTETGDASQVEQAGEVIVDEPEPSLWCNGCKSGHVAGEPVSIRSRYMGYCEGLFGSEYECAPQDYTVTVQCVTGSCQVPAPQYFLGTGAFDLTPLEPGTISIRAWMNGTSFTIPAFTSHIPDRIEVLCTAGDDRQPCAETGGNPLPVRLEFALMSGPYRLHPTQGFSLGGPAHGFSSGDVWWADDIGHVFEVRYGDLVQPVNIELGTHRDRIDDAAVEPPTRTR